jgi:hypothetical protein
MVASCDMTRNRTIQTLKQIAAIAPNAMAGVASKIELITLNLE